MSGVAVTGVDFVTVFVDDYPAAKASYGAVADVAAARAALEAHDIAFFGDTVDTGVCHMAHFADPSGNALMLHHRYAPRGEG